MVGNDKKRHLLKTVTWRITATLITIAIAWFLSGDIQMALNIGLIEVFVKMLAYYYHERFWFTRIRFAKKILKPANIHPKPLGESKEERAAQLHQNPTVFWFTGLSGSGKSAIAEELDKLLFNKGYKTFILDGDNIRWGINADLGFKKTDREENIRRIAEVAKLFNDAGIIVLTAFISPYRSSRANAKKIIGDGFNEIYVNTDIEKCMDRDVKGLYQKAIDGKIKNFTGISAPYEVPKNPLIKVDGNIDGKENTKLQAQRIFELIECKIINCDGKL